MNTRHAASPQDVSWADLADVNAALAREGIESIHIGRAEAKVIPLRLKKSYPPKVTITRVYTPRELRRAVRGKGYSPIPVEGKAPDMMKGWQKKHETNDSEIELWDRMWPNAINTGILTKFTPAIDIDIKALAAATAVEDLAREWFGELGDILVRFGQAPKRAILLRTDDSFKKIVQLFTAPDGSEHKIELLGDGQQIVIHGVHPDTGKPYSWHGGAPWTTSREELPYVREGDVRAFLEEATRILVEDFGFVAKGGKDKSKANGAGEWPAAEQDVGLLAAAARVIPNDDADWDTWNRMAMAIFAATQGSPAGLDIFLQYSRRSSKFDEGDSRDKWEKLKCSPPTQIGAGTIYYLADQADPGWRKPKRTAAISKAEPVFDPWERYIVPDFPLQVLPEVVQRYVTSQSVVIGCDPAALAMAALTAFSGALDHRFAVKMMRNGNWWEHPRLWTLLVGDPSRKKTPLINDVTRPLERHQNDLRRDYEARLRDYEAAKKEDKNTDVEKPDPPVRYVVFDTTTEKLGEILSRSDHGLLVKRDEFSGWIGGMEKYSSVSRGAGADRGFWLQAYDGGPFAVDRIGRGETYIGNLSVSLIGGIQPAKLAELHGLTSDGLLQRFLLVMMRAPSLARDCESGDDQENYQSLVYKLIRAKHQRLLLSDPALVLMNDLRAHLHKVEQAAAGLSDGLQAFVGKLAGIAGRLTVILHVAETPENTPREVAAMTVAHVHRLVLDFILPHAVEFYRSTEELTNGERLRKIASWILTSQQQVIAARDLIRNVSCLRGMSVMDLHTQVSPLIAAGWLEPAEAGPLNRTWNVNPIVPAQFERQRQIEEERKKLAAELMRSPRK
jgi:hypothetical protein